MYGPSSRNAAVPKDIYQTDPERQNRHSRSAESSSEIIYSDSPRSFNNNELEDYIIDEVLSYEDEVRSGTNKPGQLPASFSCSDNLTGMSNDPRIVSASRPINATGSSGNSVQSGSPARTIPIHSPLASSSYRQIVSSSAPSSSLDMEALVRGSAGSHMQHHGNGGQTPGTNDEFFRDRRKKDIHNMIERRRRYNINDRIKELGLMLPKHSAEDIKLNKGTILKASCDYIRQLQRDRDMFAKQQSQSAKLEQTARQYADRIRELENHMEKHGVPIPPAALPAFPPHGISPARTIKQEPFDEGSPSATPTGSLPTQGFMSQLSEMQIASPVSSSYGRSPLNSGLHYFTPSSDSPLSPPVSGARIPHVSTTSNSEYGTPASTTGWPNSGIHQNIPFHDLAMDDLTSLQTGNPLLQGDPMISASCFPHSQMSPDIQWDQAGFSPDSNNQVVHQATSASTCSQMDFS
ncbi:hypothetical protein L596_004709 [Steinernema carpocapsae]|uniref:BHLH domain-containing protein n=1 Tax=Steinernema carpocapsae TaxID=34508 RepID=A0A4U8UXQ1_STECR|nr:hypothetical protein L596_004709 [Steinernema carpocapsae]